MKQVSKKTTKILIILGLLITTAVGLTLAYYNSQKTFSNEFHVKEPGVSIYEKFNPTDWWVPGEEKSKQAWFANTGELDMLLRFKIDVDWAPGQKPKDANGNELNVDAKDVVTLYWKDSKYDENEIKGPIILPKATEENRVVGDQKRDIDGVVTDDEEDILPSGFDFIPVYQDGNTYYYYKKILKAKDDPQFKTQHVLESVKFSENLSNDGHLHSNYAGSQIDLTITGETVLVDWRAVEEQKVTKGVPQWLKIQEDHKKDNGFIDLITVGKESEVPWDSVNLPPLQTPSSDTSVSDTQ